MQVTPPHFLALSPPKNVPKTLSKPVLADFTSTDALMLRKNKRLQRTAHEALEQGDITLQKPRASITEQQDPFRKLEQEVAGYFACADAMLFSSRNQAIFSLFSLVLSEQNALHMAAHATGPLAEVCSLTGAGLQTLDPYGESLLALSGKENEITFIETIHPLTFESFRPAWPTQSLASSGRSLVVDESLALGVCGAHGLGVTESLRSSLQFSFLACLIDCSLVLGQQGCFVASSKELVQALRERSKTYRTEIPIATLFIRTISEALATVAQMEQPRQVLSSKASWVAQQIKGMGLSTLTAGPYIGVSLEKYSEAEELFEALAGRGVLTSFGLTQRPLSSQSSLRIILSTAHEEKEISLLLESMHEVTRR